MQKHFRPGIGRPGRVAPDRLIHAEALNPRFGYYYTVKKSLVRTKTRFQDLELIDTDEFGKVLLLDSITQVAEKNDCWYHEPMVHPAMVAHPRPASVLVIGGGDGGIIREVLKYPCVKTVELVELDDTVIEFSRKHLKKVHCGAFSDPRLHITIADGRHYVDEHHGAFDVVIMDMTDPSGPSRMLYTKEFFGLVRRSFKNPDGVFVMHTESPLSRPGAFACIQKTLRASFPRVTPLYVYIQMYAMLWSISLCSEKTDCLKIKASAVDKKLARYGISGLKVYTGETHHAMKTAYPAIAALLKNRVPIITDASPEFPDDFMQ
jgi:spermidine synthase